MNRWDIVNKFIQEREYKSYLEIGYYKGWSFDQIKCKNKTAVDPNPSKTSQQEELEYGKSAIIIKGSGNEKLVKKTSDEFFNTNKEKFDIIFIDGLHEVNQVQKDIKNALKVLNDKGVILVHDCNPPTEEHTLGGVNGCWNGDVYKAIMAFKEINPNIYTIDTDWGIGVIEKFDFEDVEIINELEWKDFYPHRIGLISIDEFNRKFHQKKEKLTEELNKHLEDWEIKYTKSVKTIDSVIPKEKNLVFMSAQPDDLRFSFQIEVQLENFIRMGYENDIHVLLYVPFDRIGTKNNRFVMLEERYKQSHPNIKFFWYEDTNNEVIPLVRQINYIPLLRPWTLKKHFEKYPELSKDIIFYHDNDIIFTRKLDFTPFMDDNINYLSNTDHYMNVTKFWESPNMYSRAIPEKREELKNSGFLDILAKMNGVSREILLENDNNTGGAQHILKNIDAKYWEDVFNSIIIIRSYLSYDTNGINKKFFTSENAGYQSWCADMWAVLWNLWKRGKKTETPKELDFSWATDNIKRLDSVYIYHDAHAGTDNEHYIFNKNKHQYVHNGGIILPYVEDLSYVSKDYASYYYTQEIIKVKSKYNY